MLPPLLLRSPGHTLDHLTAAVHCPVHGSDGAVVNDLHIASEVLIPYNLASAVSVHSNDAAVAQVQDVASIELQ